jgi:CheY-like chemotaxis protein
MGSERVLVVEDNELVREQGISQPEDLATVLSARDGPPALAIPESNERIDLLFTDMFMPGMSGVELAAHAGVTHSLDHRRSRKRGA